MKENMKVSVVQSCLTLWNSMTLVLQAPLSIEFSRQEYWSGWPSPSPGDFSDPGIEPWSPALQVGALLSELLQSFSRNLTCFTHEILLIYTSKLNLELE